MTRTVSRLAIHQGSRAEIPQTIQITEMFFGSIKDQAFLQRALLFTVVTFGHLKHKTQRQNNSNQLYYEKSNSNIHLNQRQKDRLLHCCDHIKREASLC